MFEGKDLLWSKLSLKLAREIFIVLFGVHMGKVVLAKISTREVV